jgi:hypothetical protein
VQLSDESARAASPPAVSFPGSHARTSHELETSSSPRSSCSTSAARTVSSRKRASANPPDKTLQLWLRERVKIHTRSLRLPARALQPTEEDLGGTRIGDRASPQTMFDLCVTRRFPVCGALCGVLGTSMVQPRNPSQGATGVALKAGKRAEDAIRDTSPSTTTEPGVIAFVGRRLGRKSPGTAQPSRSFHKNGLGTGFPAHREHGYEERGEVDESER